MKELTKAELQVMQNLWSIEKGFLRDIVEEFPDPKPANTTISTILRILVDKGFVKYETFGKSNRYYPAVSREDYSKVDFKRSLGRFWSDSPTQFASFFTKNADLSVSDLEELKRMIESELEDRKSGGEG